MSQSANSSPTKNTDDFDITKFPEIDKAIIESIWNEEQKNGQGSNQRRLASLTRSIEADISTPMERLDSFTYSEASSSFSVAEQADDDPNSSSPGDNELDVDSMSYSTIDEITKRIDGEAKDLRIPKEKAVKVKRERDRNRRKQKSKQGRQGKK